MAVRLLGGRVSAASLQAHDTRDWRVLLAVTGTLLVYAWCYTGLAARLGLATPADVAAWLGAALPRVLDDDGNVAAKLSVTYTALHDGDDERLVVFAALLGGFVSAYLLPLRRRAAAAVAWFLPAFAWLYGASAAAALLAAHLGVYATFHPRRGGRVAAVVGALCGLLSGGAWPLRIGAAAVGAAALAWGYQKLLAPALLADGRAARAIRRLVVEGCMITIAVACAAEGLTGAAWKLPVGLLFFFYQWARLLVYEADARDGLVPRELPVAEYLGLFMTPLALANVNYAPYLGQGYAYLQARLLAEDRMRLARAGLRLWWLALAYMVFAEEATERFIVMVERGFGVKVYAFTSELVRAHVKGAPLSTPTVLLSTLVDQARIFLIYGGVTHFRVGAWRVMGYAVETQYDRPWLATNLANLWGRFAYHFREFLVRVFYYPVFLTRLRRRPLLRIFTATMVATVVGNLVWGHVPPRTLGRLTWADLVTALSTWPYFVLLGLGISLTQIWLARRPRTRKPWTLDRRLPLDVVCAYLTLQYFALIHVFIRPQPGGSLADYGELALIGLGIRVR